METERAVQSTINKVLHFEKGLEKEVKGWKSKLTLGLDNTQVLISLIILGSFYFAYNITNYSLGNTRDQYSITGACFCRQKAQRFYRLWFYLFLVIWLIIYTYIFLEQTLKKIECLQNYGKFMEALRKFSFWKDRGKDLVAFCRYCCCKNKNVGMLPTSEPNLDNENRKNFRELEHYERILWYRYYKLYVVGYAKDIKPEPLKTYKKDGKPGQAFDSLEVSDINRRNYICCSDCCKGCCQHCHYILRSPVRFVLLLLKFIAQAATVPILMLQVFDTYALLCFLPNGEYCRTATEYKINVALAAITMSFLFCIVLAQLTSALLEWDSLNAQRWQE